MARLLEKRRSLHRRLQQQSRQNDQLRDHLDQMQSLANLGLVTAMIAHEMNNILTPLGTYAELALQHPDDRALAEKALRKAAVNSERAGRILESMLAMVRGERGQRDRHRVALLIDEVFACLGRDFVKDGIRVIRDIEDDLEVFGEATQLQQLFMNLILNARQAMLPSGGTLTIRGQDEPDRTRIEILDTGCGIAPENQERIFEVFFSTKDAEPGAAQGGCGLGLAFCRRVIDEHGGTIQVHSEPGTGSCFVVGLPKETAWRVDAPGDA